MREIGDNEQSPAAEIDPWPMAQQHPSWLGEPTPGYQAPGEQGEIGADHPRQLRTPPEQAASPAEPQSEPAAESNHDGGSEPPIGVRQPASEIGEPVAAPLVGAGSPAAGPTGGHPAAPSATSSDADWLTETPFADAAGWSGDGHDVPVAVPVQEVPRERWRGIEEMPTELGRRGRWTKRVPTRPARAPRSPRRLVVALPLILVFGLFAAFFSWVSSEPLWLTVGHGTAGTATVTRCVGDGIGQRCRGEFIARDAAFTAANITLMGVADTTAGRTLDARMVSANSHRAYAGGPGVMHLRWLIGLVLVLLCGVGVALASGALRLPDRGERLAALGTSLAAPLLITVGFLAAAF